MCKALLLLCEVYLYAPRMAHLSVWWQFYGQVELAISVSTIFIIPCIITSKVQSPCARLFPPFVRHFWQCQLHIVSGSAVDFRVQEVVPSLVCCPSLGCQVSLPLPPLLPWVASTTRACHQLFCRYAQTFAHRLKNQNFKTLHGNFPLSLSRLTPPLLWKASPLSPTASPTTLQAQETPSPFSRACILGGSEIHSPLLTFNTQLVSPLKPIKCRHFFPELSYDSCITVVLVLQPESPLTIHHIKTKNGVCVYLKVILVNRCNCHISE